MLTEDVYGEIDAALAPVDAELSRRYPGEPARRQPVHTVYVPADRFMAGLPDAYGTAALAAIRNHGPLPFAEDVTQRVMAKLAREPIEDLRIDFEDSFGVRDDEEEDAAARATATILRETGSPPSVGLRCKSLEAPTRRRAIRTLDVFLDTLGDRPILITVPKVSAVEQVSTMVIICERLEQTHGLPAGRLRFEVQIETPPAVLGADGTATVARMVHVAEGRCVGLHYGTYDYGAACGIAVQMQSMEHPAADFAKAMMQVAAAGTGVPVSDGSTNILPVGDTASVRAAWDLHARLVHRSLARGFYQGWDLHPAQLPTRYGATYTFFRDAAPAAVDRLGRYLSQGSHRQPRRPAGSASRTNAPSGPVLDEPATARSLARLLLRGLDCGALDPGEAGFDRSTLESL
jgi:citrate lyase beta subunit